MLKSNEHREAIIDVLEQYPIMWEDCYTLSHLCLDKVRKNNITGYATILKHLTEVAQDIVSMSNVFKFFGEEECTYHEMHSQKHLHGIEHEHSHCDGEHTHEKA